MNTIHQSRQICAVVTTTKQKTRFYLTPKGFATDIQDRAQRFNYTYDAQHAADNANREYAWRGFDWRAAVMLSNGEIAEAPLIVKKGIETDFTGLPLENPFDTENYYQ